MPAIRPVLIVGTGNHVDLVAALRAHALGPMLSSEPQQALRLLRNFRVDAVVCVHVAADAIRQLAELAPTVAVGGVERDAWSSGAAAFVASASAVTALPDIVHRVARGERGVRASSLGDGRGIA